MMKHFWMLPVLFSIPLFAGMEVCRIQPDKIVYPENTAGTMTVVVRNTGIEKESSTLRISEEWNLEKPEFLHTAEITLEPGQTKTLQFPYNSGSKRYGRVIRAELLQNGKVISRKGEYFNVINEWWRVAMGPGFGSTIGGQTPLLHKTAAYYGLKPKVLKKGKKYPHTDFSSEIIERLCPELGPFLGYGTMETRWLMTRSCIGGNYAPSQYPPDKQWYAIKFESRTTGRMLKDADIFHKWGMHHTRYTINNMESSFGFELARKHPEYILRNSRGGFEGHYMHNGVSPVTVSHQDLPCRQWVYLTPNLFEMEVLDWALDDLIAGIKAFREDGVYFDGRYCSHRGYDHLGNDLTKKYNVRDTVIRNMKHTLKRIQSELPNAYIWSNGCDATDPESALLSSSRVGVLKEIQQAFIISPTRNYHQYRSLLETVLGQRDQLRKPTENSMIKTDILHLGYLGTWNRKNIIQARECWTWSNHVMAIFAAALGHTMAYQIQFRPIRQLQTGYSAFFWDENIRVMDDGYRKFQLDSLREVWYEDTIYYKKTPKYTDYYIHLINTPETENAIDTVPVDPPAADDVEIATKLFGKEQNKIQAWTIQPYDYDSKILEPTVTKLSPKMIKKEMVFAIPPFKFYSLLVIRKYH